MTTDLPTIVRDYLDKNFPDRIGLSVGVTTLNWIYIWDTSEYPSAGYNYIALIMDTYVRPFWHPNPPLNNVAGSDIVAADPKFFELLEKLVRIYLKEKHNG